MTPFVGSHRYHITTRADRLRARFGVLRAVREYFFSHQYIEIESPLFVHYPGQEQNIDAVSTTIHTDGQVVCRGYLHTSPEYTMKKMLASGFEHIFYLGKVFRDAESITGLHHPEFTMLEWYSTGKTFEHSMDDVEQVCAAGAVYVREHFSQYASYVSRFVDRSWQRITMRDLWMQCVRIDLDHCITVEQLIRSVRERGYHVHEADSSYEVVFYRIFAEHVEPVLAQMGLVMVTHFPAPLASLARLDESGKYALRYEVYIDGVELANAFDELTDATAQESRFIHDQGVRRADNKVVYGVDIELLEALPHISQTSGVALGIDRLVMAYTGCKNIEDVLVLPMKHLFDV